jgi:coenzyme PQQ precursor peptide PqqA
LEAGEKPRASSLNGVRGVQSQIGVCSLQLAAGQQQVAGTNLIQQKNNMNESTDPEKNTEKIWKTPRFKEIPISFEASSYSLTDDDPPYR